MSRGGQAVTISILFTGLAFSFVLVRCLTKFFLVKKAGPEDVLVVFGLLFSIALTLLINAQKEHGLGRHVSTIIPSDMVMMLKFFYASIPVYYAGLTTTKVSILLQFLRFFVIKIYRRISWILIVSFSAYGIAAMIGSAFSCSPVKYFWDKSIEGGQCIDLLAFWFTLAAFNIFSDLAICILPIPSLKGLDLPKKEKYALMLVFALGGFGCITSILRLHSLYIIAKSTDVTWDNVGAATWSSVELNTGIMCGCVPAIKPLLSWIFPNLFSHSRRTTLELQQDSFTRNSAATDLTNTMEKGALSPQASDTGLRQHHQYQQQLLAQASDHTLRQLHLEQQRQKQIEEEEEQRKQRERREQQRRRLIQSQQFDFGFDRPRSLENDDQIAIGLRNALPAANHHTWETLPQSRDFGCFS